MDGLAQPWRAGRTGCRKTSSARSSPTFDLSSGLRGQRLLPRRLPSRSNPLPSPLSDHEIRMVQYRLHLDLLRSGTVMIRLFSHTRSRLIVLVLFASASITLSTAFAAPLQKKSKGLAPGASVAQRYADAVSKGDKI